MQAICLNYPKYSCFPAKPNSRVIASIDLDESGFSKIMVY